MEQAALFLDRDGVINVDHGYVYKKENFEFIDGIFELCLFAQSVGYKIIVVTNQAGIGRGYYTEHDFFLLSEWMCEKFKSKGVTITKTYFCPTHPVHGVGPYKRESLNRKPQPGMFYQAVDDFGIDLNKSMLIGDKKTDILAGLAAGVGINLLLSSVSLQSTAISGASASIAKLIEAIPFLESQINI